MTPEEFLTEEGDKLREAAAVPGAQDAHDCVHPEGPRPTPGELELRQRVAAFWSGLRQVQHQWEFDLKVEQAGARETAAGLQMNPHEVVLPDQYAPQKIAAWPYFGAKATLGIVEAATVYHPAETLLVGAGVLEVSGLAGAVGIGAVAAGHWAAPLFVPSDHGTPVERRRERQAAIAALCGLVAAGGIAITARAAVGVVSDDIEGLGLSLAAFAAGQVLFLLLAVLIPVHLRRRRQAAANRARDTFRADTEEQVRVLDQTIEAIPDRRAVVDESLGRLIVEAVDTYDEHLVSNFPNGLGGLRWGQQLQAERDGGTRYLFFFGTDHPDGQGRPTPGLPAGHGQAGPADPPDATDTDVGTPLADGPVPAEPPADGDSRPEGMTDGPAPAADDDEEDDIDRWADGG